MPSNSVTHFCSLLDGMQSFHSSSNLSSVPGSFAFEMAPSPSGIAAPEGRDCKRTVSSQWLDTSVANIFLSILLHMPIRGNRSPSFLPGSTRKTDTFHLRFHIFQSPFPVHRHWFGTKGAFSPRIPSEPKGEDPPHASGVQHQSLPTQLGWDRASEPNAVEAGTFLPTGVGACASQHRAGWEGRGEYDREDR